MPSNETLDLDIARELFGVPQTVLDAWPWGVPKFSDDRRWSAAVVTALWNKSDDVRQVFETQLMTNAEKLRVKGALTELLVVNTPDEICKAALMALRQCATAEQT